MGHIFWDFDGTLVQSSPLWRRAMLEALGTVCPDHSISLEALAPPVGVGFPWHGDHAHGITSSADWWARMEAKFSNDFLALGFDRATSDKAAKLIRARILDRSAYREFPEVRGVLTRLSGRGWRHVILSNNHPDLHSLMKDLGLADFFDHIVTSGRVGFEKPRPEIFHFSLQQAQADPTLSWMIGDSLAADVRGAEAIGLKAILVRSKAEAKYRADDLTGAEEIITSIAERRRNHLPS